MPAQAANNAPGVDNVVSKHEVRFQNQAFICREIKDCGKIRWFMRGIPEVVTIPELEPRASDPLAQGWLITYWIICEGAIGGPTSQSILAAKGFRLLARG